MANDLEARLARVETQLQELQDREAIRELRFRYHEYVNQGRWSEIPDLFTEDGELDFGYLGKGRGRERLTRLFQAGSPPVAIAAGEGLTPEQAEILSHMSLIGIAGEPGRPPRVGTGRGAPEETHHEDQNQGVRDEQAFLSFLHAVPLGTSGQRQNGDRLHDNSHS